MDIGIKTRRNVYLYILGAELFAYKLVMLDVDQAAEAP